MTDISDNVAFTSAPLLAQKFTLNSLAQLAEKMKLPMQLETTQIKIDEYICKYEFVQTRFPKSKKKRIRKKWKKKYGRSVCSGHMYSIPAMDGILPMPAMFLICPHMMEKILWEIMKMPVFNFAPPTLSHLFYAGI